MKAKKKPFRPTNKQLKEAGVTRQEAKSMDSAFEAKKSHHNSTLGTQNRLLMSNYASNTPVKVIKNNYKTIVSLKKDRRPRI